MNVNVYSVRIQKVAVVANFKMLFQHLPKGTEKKKYHDESGCMWDTSVAYLNIVFQHFPTGTG